MTDWRSDRIGSALRGENPTVLARMPGGFVVDWEPAELVGKPVWLYPAERWSDPATALGPEHDTLRAAIARHLSAGLRV